MTAIDVSGKEAFSKIVGKAENVGNQHFLLFPTLFFTLLKTKITIYVTFILSSADISVWIRSIFLSSGNGLAYIVQYFRLQYVIYFYCIMIEVEIFKESEKFRYADNLKDREKFRLMSASANCAG